ADATDQVDYSKTSDGSDEADAANDVENTADTPAAADHDGAAPRHGADTAEDDFADAPQSTGRSTGQESPNLVASSEANDNDVDRDRTGDGDSNSGSADKAPADTEQRESADSAPAGTVQRDNAVVQSDSAPVKPESAERRLSSFDEVVDGGFGIGSAQPIADGAQPLGHPVKGWHDLKSFVAPGEAGYDGGEPDVWFFNEDAARRAGFTPQGEHDA
ncbi:MAG: MSCRAMM family adhesin SdrC, partial [Actinomycetota bacterium]|nr:MSCRAMM family adhesin SdrC [Actinomycetota bacterium]